MYCVLFCQKNELHQIKTLLFNKLQGGKSKLSSKKLCFILLNEVKKNTSINLIFNHQQMVVVSIFLMFKKNQTHGTAKPLMNLVIYFTSEKRVSLLEQFFL